MSLHRPGRRFALLLAVLISFVISVCVLAPSSASAARPDPVVATFEDANIKAECKFTISRVDPITNRVHGRLSMRIRWNSREAFRQLVDVYAECDVFSGFWPPCDSKNDSIKMVRGRHGRSVSGSLQVELPAAGAQYYSTRIDPYYAFKDFGWYLPGTCSS